eukprot:GHUV01029497.1.p1 GENE.GHUV01029497.1~~GHUV01029497.1.p1  ORF type:complete len:169 (-),score=40.74 GHUV01029497.1:523-1029(-)
MLSRFDLIFVLLDRPDELMDQALSEHVMALHSGERERTAHQSTSTPGYLAQAMLLWMRQQSGGSTDCSVSGAWIVQGWMLRQLQVRGRQRTPLGIVSVPSTELVLRNMLSCCAAASRPTGLADRAAAARQRLLQHQQAQAISQAPSLSGMLSGGTQPLQTQGTPGGEL